MLTGILLALAVILVVFVIVVALQPADFCVTRTAMIATTPTVVFAHVNDLRKFQTWNPFMQIDPAANISFLGPTAGVGAAYTWEGNGKAAGRMRIVESSPDELIRCKLEFLKPFRTTNSAEFTFMREGQRIRVTWSMSGRFNSRFKAVGLFMNHDKMCDGVFEQGLTHFYRGIPANSDAAIGSPAQPLYLSRQCEPTKPAPDDGRM
ncbi:MAG: SRPBCC family protein [Opitutaceae bacterium]|nr:SRPBCC family protein [Opitutaceae bacterium]